MYIEHDLCALFFWSFVLKLSCCNYKILFKCCTNWTRFDIDESTSKVIFFVIYGAQHLLLLYGKQHYQHSTTSCVQRRKEVIWILQNLRVTKQNTDPHKNKNMIIKYRFIACLVGKGMMKDLKRTHLVAVHHFPAEKTIDRNEKRKFH